MTTLDIIKRRLLSLLRGVQSLSRGDVTQAFGTDSPAAFDALDEMIRDGVLLERDGRFWPGRVE